MANLFKRLNEASIPRVFETSVNLLLKEVVGQRLAFLRKSHGGYNMPQACCQVPPFVPVLTPVFALLEVVGQNGLEPSTSRLSVVCSSQLSYWPVQLLLGGEYRDRTGDLLLARQALSQLS